MDSPKFGSPEWNAKYGIKSKGAAKPDPKAPKLGGGKRFKKLTSQLAAKGATDPAALAAFIGRKKFGASKFRKLAK